MEKKFNIVVGEDGTVKLPDAVLEKLEVKPGEEVRFEVDDNFYAVRLLSRIEAERFSKLEITIRLLSFIRMTSKRFL